MKKLKIIRHGDCGLHVYDPSLHGEIIKGKQIEPDENGITLLKGEATYHHHLIKKGAQAWEGKVSRFEDIPAQIVETDCSTEIEHWHVKENRPADHAPLPLEEPVYIQDFQVEFWPDGYQRVSD